MGNLGGRTLNRLGKERFYDILSDSLNRVHKSASVFYVDSNTGSSAYNGRRLESPFATIAQAISAATASQGDVIFVLPNHTETTTAAISMSKADVTLKGLEVGNKRPVITVNGAVDLLSLDAAGCSASGLDLTIATTDAATSLLNIAAAKCSVSNIKMIPSSGTENVVDCITVTSAANDSHVENVRIFNTTVAVNSFLSLEGAAARVMIKGCHFSGDVATGGIIDAATVTFLRLIGNIVKVVGTNMPACTLDSNPTGEAIGNYMFGTDATIANNANWGSALILANNYTRGGTGSTVSASNIIPALDT